MMLWGSFLKVLTRSLHFLVYASSYLVFHGCLAFFMDALLFVR